MGEKTPTFISSDCARHFHGNNLFKVKVLMKVPYSGHLLQ